MAITGQKILDALNVIESNLEPNKDSEIDVTSGSLVLTNKSNNLFIKHGLTNTSFGQIRALFTKVIETSSSTLILYPNSVTNYIFTGNQPQQVINLGESTSHFIGKVFKFYNRSNTIIKVNNYSGQMLFRLPPYEDIEFRLGNDSTSDGLWHYSYNQKIDKNLVFEQFTDWNTNSIEGETGWVSGNSGGTTTLVSTSDALIPGTLQLSVSKNGNIAYLYQGASSSWCNIYMGGGVTAFETKVKIPTLANGSNNYTFRIGLGDALSASTTDSYSCMFEYNFTSSANWRLGASDNQVYSYTDSGITISANTWYTLRWECYYDASQVDYYINDSFVGSVSTNVPNTSVLYDQVTPIIRLWKTAGNTARTILIDYFWIKKWFENGR